MHTVIDKRTPEIWKEWVDWHIWISLEYNARKPSSSQNEEKRPYKIFLYSCYSGDGNASVEQCWQAEQYKAKTSEDQMVSDPPLEISDTEGES